MWVSGHYFSWEIIGIPPPALSRERDILVSLVTTLSKSLQRALAMYSYNQVVCKIWKSNIKFNVVKPHIVCFKSHKTWNFSILYMKLYSPDCMRNTHQLLIGTLTRIFLQSFMKEDGEMLQDNKLSSVQTHSTLINLNKTPSNGSWQWGWGTEPVLLSFWKPWMNISRILSNKRIVWKLGIIPSQRWPPP